MPTTTIFTPSSGTPVTVGLSPMSSQFAMPAVDGSNLDLCITNQTGSPAYLVFAVSAPNAPVAAGPTYGSVVIPGMAQVLLTAKTSVLALMGNNPLVATGPQATLAQTATAATGSAGGVGTILTVQRGTAVATPSWSA